MAFSTQEKVEVLKVVQAAQMLPSAVKKISAAVGAATAPLSDGDHAKYSNAISRVGGAARLINLILQELLWSYEVIEHRTTGRPAALARAWDAIDGLVTSLQFGIDNGLKPVAEFQTAIPIVQKIMATLQSVDRTLAYAEPFPTSYPRIIGPHGDYDGAQAMMCVSSKYLDEALTGILMLYRNNFATWPVAANPDVQNLLDLSQAAQALYTRIMGMSAEVVLPDDEATINSDAAHGSGLRPNSFFRALFMHELAMTAEQLFKNFAGRTVQKGISFHLVRILGSVGSILAEFSKVVTDDQLYLQLTTNPSFMGDFGRCWKSLDQWSDMNLLFFFEIPAPPPGPSPDPTPTPAVIPAGFFAADIAALQALKNEATDVAARADAEASALLAKEGTTI